MQRVLIKGATILSADPAIGVLDSGDLLIHDSKIVEIAPTIDATDCEIVDATGRIALPGFIDTHRHVWESILRNVAADWQGSQYFSGIRAMLGGYFGPDEIYAANLVGVAEALDMGITTIFDWSHNVNTPECADAAVLALNDSGGRVLFGLGDPNALWLPVSDVASDAQLAKRIRTQYFSANTGLVTMAMSVRGPEYTTLEVTRQDVALARDLDLKMSIHVGNGARLAANDAPVIALNDAGLIGADMLFVHCNQSTDEELRIMAEAGCPPPSVTPDSEAHFGLGFPAASRLMEIGLRPSLGIDIVINALGDMFGTFRTLAAIERARQHDSSESMPARLQLTSRDLIEMATVEGARSIWKSDVIGSLTPGKQADIVLLKADTLHHSPLNNLYGAVALGSHAGDVESVLVAGKFVKRDGVLSADVTRIRHLAERARDAVVRRAYDDGRRSVSVTGDWFPEPYVRREG